MKSRGAGAEGRAGLRISARIVCAAVLVAGLGAALRLGCWDRVAVEHFDEGVYASNLWFGAEEHFQYPDRFLYAPPLVPALAEISLMVFGSEHAAAAVPGVLFGLLTIAAGWWLGRMWYGAAAGWFAAVLIAASDFHAMYSRSVLTDVPLGFWFLVAVGLAWSATVRGNVRLAAAAGAACGLAWWTKYNGWLPLAVAVSGTAAWLTERRLQQWRLDTKRRAVNRAADESRDEPSGGLPNAAGGSVGTAGGAANTARGVAITAGGGRSKSAGSGHSNSAGSAERRRDAARGSATNSREHGTLAGGEAGRLSAGRAWAVVGVVAAVAVAAWSPVWWSLRDFGGYERVSANHRQYWFSAPADDFEGAGDTGAAGSSAGSNANLGKLAPQRSNEPPRNRAASGEGRAKWRIWLAAARRQLRVQRYLDGSLGVFAIAAVGLCFTVVVAATARRSTWNIAAEDRAASALPARAATRAATSAATGKAAGTAAGSGAKGGRGDAPAVKAPHGAAHATVQAAEESRACENGGTSRVPVVGAAAVAVLLTAAAAVVGATPVLLALAAGGFAAGVLRPYGSVPADATTRWLGVAADAPKPATAIGRLTSAAGGAAATGTAVDAAACRTAFWWHLAWWTGLLVATPCYYPYPRIALPFLLATWIGAAGTLAAIAGAAVRLRKPDAGPSSGRSRPADGDGSTGQRGQGGSAGASPSRKPGAGRLIAAGVTAAGVFVTAAAATSGVPQREDFGPHAWQDRTQLRRAVREAEADIAADAAAEPGGDADRWAVYVVAAPAVVHHLLAAGRLAQPAGNSAFLDDRPHLARFPIYLVVGPHAERQPEWAEVLRNRTEQLREIGEYAFAASDLVLLDQYAPSAVAAHRIQRLRVWRVLPR